ncbi:hypothetical protein PVAP13_6NG101003 [Panicum virgatum]|uniref:Uncharacterized protein n=1 Tax=Panicum virgatum TaxID=38727 RepID=A0A8T0QWD4_PANVG|nr:hypothetical protein PVAP13_6NG101003 [Panicum virgatum]
MEAVRGPPKKKLKKASTCSTETSIVVPIPASGMVFPHNEAVANATHKKRKRTSSTKTGVTKRKGTSTSTSTSTADTRSGTGSNDPLPLQVLQPVPLLQDTGCPEATEHTVQTPRKKCAIKKNLHKRGLLQLWQPARPAPLQIPQARSNSSLNKV